MSTKPNDTNLPSNIHEQTLQPGNRHYTVAVPHGYSDEVPVPLVMAFHYAGHGSPYYGKLMLLDLIEPALRELGAIIVAPDCTAPDWTHPQSEGDVLELLDHIESNYLIDMSKRLVTGYSLGGIGTWHMALEHPDRFSAAIVMAGIPPSNIHELQLPMPFYVIHSRDDEFMPLNRTVEAVDTLQSRDAPIELMILEGITHFQTWRYTEPLRMTIPWLEGVWGEEG
ncbi:MAG: prolyl oligopeptidase family serine peptidase [Anaerolineales bacterium]|nr:prolyl oligopeptidase family serine peptidase [Anaerolineales bacterium]